MIKAGEKLPEGSFWVKDDEGNVKEVSTLELFGGQKVVLVGVPAAFSSTCHKAHIPLFVENAEKIKAMGVDRIAVMAVNDHHVMKVWSDALGATGKIDFLADGAANFARAIGTERDMSKTGLGLRSRRFSMIVEDGIVRKINLEPEGGRGVTVTGAPTMLEQL
jgi:glutaredoxin/glutathione-dependent peroxiredoxin